MARTGAKPQQRDGRVDLLDVAMIMVIVAVAGFLLWRIDHPIGARPDSWSEAQVIISGWGYAQSGFWSHAGLPQYQVGPPVDPYFLYTSYPALSNLLYGALHVAGADVHGAHRLPAILCSLIALWVWFRLILLIGDRTTASFATIALASSFGFLAYADNIHTQAYPLPLQLAALLCCARATTVEGAAGRKWLLGAGACAFVVALITVELHLWLPIACAGIGLPLRRGLSLRAAAVVAFAITLGLAVQWSQSRFGSPVPAEERLSLSESIYRRSIGFEAAVDTPRDAAGARLTIGTYPFFVAQRFGGFYRIPIGMLALLAILAVAAARARSGQRWPPSCILLLPLLVAGLAWFATMMQQSAVHPAALRQLLPFYALVLGILWNETLHAWSAKGRWTLLKTVLVLAALLSAGLHAWKTWDDVRDHSGPLKSGLEGLEQLPRDAVVLTNDHLTPFVRYWSRRPTYWTPNGLPMIGERSYLDLTFHYLRQLYDGRVPRLVYVYRFVGENPADAAAKGLEGDPLLRLLVTGHTKPFATNAEREHALRTLLGAAETHCPRLLAGGSWIAFEMGPVIAPIMQLYQSGTVPTVRELPPPI